MYYKVGFSYNIGHHLEDWAALRLDPLIVLVVFVFSTRKSCDEKNSHENVSSHTENVGCISLRCSKTIY